MRASAGVREGLSLGVIWFVVCILIDAPLMLLGGPMHMSVGAYFADIGLTYVSIPIVTWGLAAARGAAVDTRAARGSVLASVGDRGSQGH